LLIYSSYLPLGVPNWTVIHINTVPPQATKFSGAVAGEKEDFCKGTHILYFVLSFALLYFCLHHFIKNTKKLVSY
jgi:hypothetical protein